MKGINVEYSLNPEYFEVGTAYRLRMGTNDFKVGLLTSYSREQVTFKMIDNKGKLFDLTLKLFDLKYNDYDLIRLVPDYKDGYFYDE